MAGSAISSRFRRFAVLDLGPELDALLDRLSFRCLLCFRHRIRQGEPYTSPRSSCIPARPRDRHSRCCFRSSLTRLTTPGLPDSVPRTTSAAFGQRWFWQASETSLHASASSGSFRAPQPVFLPPIFFRIFFHLFRFGVDLQQERLEDVRRTRVIETHHGNDPLFFFGCHFAFQFVVTGATFAT